MAGRGCENNDGDTIRTEGALTGPANGAKGLMYQRCIAKTLPWYSCAL